MLKVDELYCMDVFSFLEKLDDASIDLAIVDPPYNLSKDFWDKFKNKENFLNFTYRYLDILIKKIKPNGSLYIFNTAENSAYIITYLTNNGLFFKNSIIWYKKDGFNYSKTKYINNQETIVFFTKSKSNYIFNYDDIRVPYKSESRINAAKTKGIIKNGKRWYPNEKGKLCTDVWEFPSVRLKNKDKGITKKQFHPTPKPIDMIKRMIVASSNDGSLVLDLFSGTGTTSLVAKKLKRHYIGCDFNFEYVEFAKERIEKSNEL